jgi:hypothetical protein
LFGVPFGLPCPDVLLFAITGRSLRLVLLFRCVLQTSNSFLSPVAVFTQQLDFCPVQSTPFKVVDDVLYLIGLSPLGPVVVDVIKVENVWIVFPTQNTFPPGLLNELVSNLLELTTLLFENLMLVE